MASPALGGFDDTLAVDLDKLLSPISAEEPSGASLRYDAIYDQIKDARQEESADLARGVWQRELKRADWSRVVSLCLDALETRSKDLQLAAWLLEAWIHTNGINGAIEGLKLINGLCEGFWDDLHPRIEGDDGIEVRVAPVQWVNDKVSEALKRVPITRPASDNATAYSWSNWEDACHLASIKKMDANAAAAEEDKGRVSQEKFRASETLTPRQFYDRLLRELERAREEVVTLEGFLDAKCGDGGPSLSRFRHTIEEIHGFTSTVLRHRKDQGEPFEPDSSEDEGRTFTELDEESEEILTGSAGPIRSRAEAYRRLTEAADYLARTEPHSPTPFLVRRAVSWGSMTLGELFEELLQDKADLQTIYKLLGIRAEDPGN